VRVRLAFVCLLAAVLTGLLLPESAGAAELFRYRLQIEDGRLYERAASQRSISRNEAIRIAADCRTCADGGSLVIFSFLGNPKFVRRNLSIQKQQRREANDAI
jgi:hypothetical protein